MSLPLLLRGELVGFYRSKVMLALWVGLPVLSVALYLLSPDLGGITVAAFTSILVGSLGGTLSSAMLAVSIISERDRHVYDLFLIRPVRRRDLLLAKFLAVSGCVLVAGLLAQGLGTVVDLVRPGGAPPLDVTVLASSLIILVSMVVISASAGILIGVVSPSALVAVILVLYGGNQLASAAILPVLLEKTEIWFPLVPGAGITAALLVGAIVLFSRSRL